VLGLATGLLVVTAQRARHLAGQQMAFVAGVSHELRTPLAVICSAAENLADGIVQDPEQAGRYGVLIRDEGRRLSGMVEQVLGLVAAGSGRQTYAFAAAALPDVLARAEADNRSLLDQAGMTLETRVSHALPPVRADLAALGAALGNLIQNAVKYAGEGGWVSLKRQPPPMPPTSKSPCATGVRGSPRANSPSCSSRSSVGEPPGMPRFTATAWASAWCSTS
jgi:signal transduction histidine kinase